jgi:hypothetical protein
MLLIPEIERNIPVEELFDEDEGVTQPSGSPNVNAKKIEFEVRIGTTNPYNKSFEPGIKEHDFMAYKKLLQEDLEMSCDFTDTTLYYLQPTQSGNVRVEVSDDVPRNAQIKKRYHFIQNYQICI